MKKLDDQVQRMQKQLDDQREQYIQMQLNVQRAKQQLDAQRAARIQKQHDAERAARIQKQQLDDQKAQRKLPEPFRLRLLPQQLMYHDIRVKNWMADHKAHEIVVGFDPVGKLMSVAIDDTLHVAIDIYKKFTQLTLQLLVNNITINQYNYKTVLVLHVCLHVARNDLDGVQSNIKILQILRERITIQDLQNVGFVAVMLYPVLPLSPRISTRVHFINVIKKLFALKFARNKGRYTYKSIHTQLVKLHGSWSTAKRIASRSDLNYITIQTRRLMWCNNTLIDTVGLNDDTWENLFDLSVITNTTHISEQCLRYIDHRTYQKKALIECDAAMNDLVGATIMSGYL
jgi:hypothetical protein